MNRINELLAREGIFGSLNFHAHIARIPISKNSSVNEWSSKWLMTRIHTGAISIQCLCQPTNPRRGYTKDKDNPTRARLRGFICRYTSTYSYSRKACHTRNSLWIRSIVN